MMVLDRVPMPEQEDAPSRPWLRWLSVAGLGWASLFLAGVVIGFSMRHIEKGSALAARPVLTLVVLVGLLAACLWMLVRALRTPAGEEPLTRKERLNRNILIACGALGGVMGVAVATAERGQLGSGGGFFSNSPLPYGFALLLVLVTGIVVPAISIYWHRHAADEQEADAYKVGALYALSIYMIGTPVWWFAWRGGFAPAPDGIAIYMITVATAGAIWMYKKYR